MCWTPRSSYSPCESFGEFPTPVPNDEARLSVGIPIQSLFKVSDQIKVKDLCRGIGGPPSPGVDIGHLCDKTLDYDQSEKLKLAEQKQRIFLFTMGTN